MASDVIASMFARGQLDPVSFRAAHDYQRADARGRKGRGGRGEALLASNARPAARPLSERRASVATIRGT
jgi:hypothetical protein